MELPKKINNNEHSDNSEMDLIKFLVPKQEYIEKTYAKLAEHRCIFISEDFTKDMAATIVGLLLYYDKKDPTAPISIYINSNGGDGAALSAIYDTINLISAPIQTICMGKCYSAGAFLLAAGTKGMRYVFKHSQILIHEIQVLFPTLLDDQVDSKIHYDLLDTFNNQILKMLSKHTGQPLNKIKEDCKKDKYFTAKEAIEYGIADFILV